MTHQIQNEPASAATEKLALTRSEPNQNKADSILAPQLLFMVVRHLDGCKTLRTGIGGHCNCQAQTELVSEAEFLAIKQGAR
jgi:hypothetical protein